MTRIIENTSQITPAWLSSRTRGAVTDISIETFRSFFADFYRLRVTYEGNADLPHRMVLKVPFADNEGALEMGRGEVKAYRAIFELMPAPLVPFFFAAEIDEKTGRSQLLLQDLSDSHISGNAKENISARQWEAAIRTLAELHAFWWESEKLGTIGQLLTVSDIDGIEARMKNDLPKFFSQMGDEITPEIRKAYEAALKFLPGFWRERYTAAARNTLIHGDAHSWNFLFPRPECGEDGRAFMIDLATLRVRPPTNDLAYLMALKWKRDLRAQLEMPLLKYYYAAFTSIKGEIFSWEECLLEYRYSILTHLFTPVGQCAGNSISPYIWQDNFRRITAAFEDLKCDELL